jgi:hypothetical protein
MGYNAARMLLATALAVKVALSAPPGISGNCDRTRVHFTGRISSDTAGPVRYTWVRSDKPSTATFTLQFDKPASLPVTYDWLLKGPAEGWVVLHVISPVDAHSEKVRFDVSCKK